MMYIYYVEVTGRNDHYSYELLFDNFYCVYTVINQSQNKLKDSKASYRCMYITCTCCFCVNIYALSYIYMYMYRLIYMYICMYT